MKKGIFNFSILIIGIILVLLSSGIRCISLSDESSDASPAIIYTTGSAQITTCSTAIPNLNNISYKFDGKVICGRCSPVNGISNISITAMLQNGSGKLISVLTDANGNWNLTFEADVIQDLFYLLVEDIDGYDNAYYGYRIYQIIPEKDVNSNTSYSKHNIEFQLAVNDCIY